MRVLPVIAAALLLSVALRSVREPLQNATDDRGVIGLVHAICSTSDIERTLAFYRNVFALTGGVSNFDLKDLMDPDALVYGGSACRNEESSQARMPSVCFTLR